MMMPARFSWTTLCLVSAVVVGSAQEASALVRQLGQFPAAIAPGSKAILVSDRRLPRRFHVGEVPAVARVLVPVHLWLLDGVAASKASAVHPTDLFIVGS
jgi:hypothetical protein